MHLLALQGRAELRLDPVAVAACAAATSGPAISQIASPTATAFAAAVASAISRITSTCATPVSPAVAAATVLRAAFTATIAAEDINSRGRPGSRISCSRHGSVRVEALLPSGSARPEHGPE